MQSNLDALMAKVNEAEEQISELEDGMVEEKAKTETWLNKIQSQECRLREITDAMKCSNVRISFINYFKELVSLIISTVLLISISLVYVLIFINSLFLLGLGFIYCSFSSYVRCKIRLCFEAFLVSWERRVLLYTSPLRWPLLHPKGFKQLCFHFHLFPWFFLIPL